MAELAWSLLIVAAVVCTADANRIVGGEPTTIEQYPSIVQVERLTGFLWTHSCSANVLTSLYVLSAAHCFDGFSTSPRNRRIRAGTTTLSSGGVIVDVESAVNHPSYGIRGADGDISVIRLVTPLQYSSVIQPATIVPQGFELPENLPVVLAGWGSVSLGGASSTELRDVQVFTINHENCTGTYASLPRPLIVTENMICAGIPNVGGKDACERDAGGPMYYENFLIGIVSWGRGCADPIYPGVKTKVSSYTDWIVSTAV